MRFRNLILLIISTSLNSFGQILDDSTKQVYGFNSVYYITENDLLKNQKIEHRPDTSIHNFYKSDIILKNNWQYQDLGNVGTAQKSFFFSPDKNISQQAGYHVFELYAPKIEDFKFYHTRSPYTDLNYTQGFKGYSRLDFLHSQNINKQLNITLEVSKFNSSKQIDAVTAEDKLVDHWMYNIGGNYFSKNKKYQLLAAFYHFNHSQNEQGGILEKSNLSIKPEDLLANYRNNYSGQLLAGVYNREKWNNFHLFHQMILKNGFQIFQSVDFQHEKRIFLDPLLSKNKFAKAYRLDSSISVNDTLKTNFLFNAFNHKIGFKGRFKGFNYEVYGRQRLYNQENRYFENLNQNLKPEIFFGGALRYFFPDSSNFLNADGEFSINSFYVNGIISFKGLQGQFFQSIRPAGLFFENYDNGILSWQNNFGAISNTFIKASYDLNFGKIRFQPAVSNTLYANYIYLNKELFPQQASSAFTVLQIHALIGYQKGRVNLSTVFDLGLNSNSDIFRLPKFQNYTNAEFDITYAKVLHIKTGLDFFYKSKYAAEAYSPMLNHFYLQDDFQVWGSFVVDPYLSFNINKVRLAFKFGHVNQGLPNNGFYVSPYYLAMPRAFLLKVNWPLFD